MAAEVTTNASRTFLVNLYKRVKRAVWFQASDWPSVEKGLKGFGSKKNMIWMQVDQLIT